MFKIVHETYSLIPRFALANAFKPLTVFWLNQDAGNVTKNYKLSSSSSFCCCTYSEEYVTESLQPEPSFPPHPPDVTWLGMQKNRTISTGERGTQAHSHWGGQPHWERQGHRGRAAGRSHAEAATPRLMQRAAPLPDTPARTKRPSKRTQPPGLNLASRKGGRQPARPTGSKAPEWNAPGHKQQKTNYGSSIRVTDT